MNDGHQPWLQRIQTERRRTEPRPVDTEAHVDDLEILLSFYRRRVMDALVESIAPWQERPGEISEEAIDIMRGLVRDWDEVHR